MVPGTMLEACESLIMKRRRAWGEEEGMTENGITLKSGIPRGVEDQRRMDGRHRRDKESIVARGRREEEREGEGQRKESLGFCDWQLANAG